MELGEKLKALRTGGGVWVVQLAAKLYVSRTAVSKWVTGGGAPSAAQTVGERELEAGEVAVKNLAEHSQEAVALSAEAVAQAISTQ